MSILLGMFIGTAIAFFLITLEWVTQFRTNHTFVLFGLPVAGLVIGWVYHKFGNQAVRGNNLLLESYETETEKIPFRMAPLVYLGTILTHLFGGSAGREGTAVQIGGAFTAQVERWIPISSDERKTLLLMGISGGFAAVFGTPLAGILFAFELVLFSRVKLQALFPVIFIAFFADFWCHFCGATHTLYAPLELPQVEFSTFVWIILAGLIFGATALLFSLTGSFLNRTFVQLIPSPIWLPFIGGMVLMVFFATTGLTQFMGLGIPSIVDAFEVNAAPTDFLIKLLLTTFTLAVGFKGGEVTPLFFVGATLGSALALFVPLPISLLAGMGFVAVFSGATHTPVACTVMGMELFGWEVGVYLGIACYVAFLISNSMGIYRKQVKANSRFFRV